MGEVHERTDIIEVLRTINGGKLAAYASELLAQVSLAVAHTEKKGSVTLTFEVAPNPKTNSFIVEVKIKLTTPTQPQAALYFIDEFGNLVRDDPDQMALFTTGADEPVNITSIRKGNAS